ncbi:MAG: hypothetical protein J6X19_00990, partial [Clostridia bacterium]|nr:hypothetical protein [Clostridia bacterium]
MPDKFTIDGNLFAVAEPHAARNEFAALRKQNAELLNRGQTPCSKKQGEDEAGLPAYEAAAE